MRGLLLLGVVRAASASYREGRTGTRGRKQRRWQNSQPSRRSHPTVVGLHPSGIGHSTTITREASSTCGAKGHRA